MFGMRSENQTAVDVDVVQGKDGSDLADCQYIGKVELRGLPTGPTNTPRITVDYEYDSSGIIHVNVTDSVSGKTNQGKIEHQSGMSDKELSNAMKKVQKHSN
jgi:molecular chaperone DnaK (HSP70)